MKAVVLEVRDGVAAVLREDGAVEKLRRDCRVGETIEIEEGGKLLRFPGRTAKFVAAAAAALIVLGAGGSYGYNNAYAYSYVTMDANPSVEYVLNRRGKVLRVDALNEDGETLAAELSSAGVKNASLSDAIDETTRLLYEENILGSEEDYLLFNVTSRGEAQEQSLLEEIDAYFRDRSDETLNVLVTNADEADRTEARALGVSTGRYVVIRDIEGKNAPESEPMTREDIDRFAEDSVGGLLEREGERFSERNAGPGETPQDGEPMGRGPGGQAAPGRTTEGTAPDTQLTAGEMPAADSGSASGEPS